MFKEHTCSEESRYINEWLMTMMLIHLFSMSFYFEKLEFKKVILFFK